jgi:uncharacterized membrane protein YdjX (TVP38/TMEM64 family)
MPPTISHEVTAPDEREAAGVGAPRAPWLAAALLWALPLGVGIGLGFYVDLAAIDFDDATTRATEVIRSWGAMAAAASIGLMILHGVVPAPAEIIAVANFMVFGPYWGFVVTWVGAMAAASVAFGLSRYLGRPFLQRILSARRYAQIDRWAVQQSVPALLLCRLIPLVSFNAVNFGAGLMSISWWTFIWTTAVGIVPATLVVLLVTESVLAENMVIGALATAAASVFVAFWLWRRSRRTGSRR